MTKRGQTLLQVALFVGWLGGLQGCANMPRIVVLHDPLTPHEHVTLGEAYQAQRHGELAAQEFEAALRLQTEYVPALVGLGNLAYEANALEKAEGFYRRVLAAAPEHPGASNNLALVYLARGERLDEAERMTRNAVVHGGSIRPYALDTLARIYARQGRYREAMVALETALAMVPAENTDLREQLSRSKRELAAAYSPHE